MDEFKKEVSVDFAGEDIVDGVSSVDGSASGLDFDGALRVVVFSRFLRGRFAMEARGIGPDRSGMGLFLGSVDVCVNA